MWLCRHAERIVKRGRSADSFGRWRAWTPAFAGRPSVADSDHLDRHPELIGDPNGGHDDAMADAERGDVADAYCFVGARPADPQHARRF